MSDVTEKLYDIPIDSPLTEARRETISKFIVENAHRFPMPIEHSWVDGAEPTLNLVTKPVTWTACFHHRSVEVSGMAPRWASMFLTKKLREEVRGHIESILQHAGFVTTGTAQA
jgi:hypothetical protein